MLLSSPLMYVFTMIHIRAWGYASIYGTNQHKKMRGPKGECQSVTDYFELQQF